MNIPRFIRNIVANGRPRFQFMQQLVATAFVGTWVTLVDGATITPDCAAGNYFMFTAATNGVRAFQVPTNIIAGDDIRIIISNTSGGALTNTSFAAGIKQPAAITYPATGFKREYRIISDGTTVSLIAFSGADCAN